MKNLLIKISLVFSALVAGMWAQAADTDLFAQGPGAGGAASVLFILDNSANSSASVDSRCSISPPPALDTPGTVTTTSTVTTNLTPLSGSALGMEQCALYAAVSALDASSTSTLHIGIMVFNNTGQKDFDPATGTFQSNCPGSVGGCLIVPIVEMNATNKRNLLEYIRQWTSSGGSNYNVKANNAANGATMQEAWAYVEGLTGLSGRNYSLVKPVAPCAKPTIIFIGNDYRNNSTPTDATGDAGPLNALKGTNSVPGKNATPTATTEEKTPFNDTMTNLGCPTDSTVLSTAENGGAYALNWALYYKNHGGITYTIGVLGPTCNAIYAGHLKKMGDVTVGGGLYFKTTNYAELNAAIASALSKIISQNSAFASVSLPLNANVQGQYLNQVFIGMFRPDKTFKPRWPGNMKQFKLGLVGQTDLKLMDADTKPAIDPASGFIDTCARSFWTGPKDAADTYWNGADVSGTCQTYEKADSPDGNVVERGAQAHVLRGTQTYALTPRTVKTCSDPTTFPACSLADFSTATVAITPTSLGLTSTDTVGRANLIEWARGLNNAENELSKGAAAVRPYIHGDVVHSRPVAVNYGTNKVVVFYGGNDGMLRAVNGNQTVTYNVSAGAELWSFMPPEFLPRINRQRTNTDKVSFPGSGTGSPKDYGMDGPISALQIGNNPGDPAYIFATMRRGGRVIYAFNVTDPMAPTVAWRRGCPNLGDDTGCSTGYTGIGQTWSTPKVVYVAGYESGATPLLIMGGGYDNCEDYDQGGKNNNCGTTKGNKIYIIKATTGEVVKSFDTDRAVIADSTIVVDANGKAVYAYTADMGGNVYRIRLIGADTDWSKTKIAALGCNNGGTCNANRKFAFQPSVVTTDDLTYFVMLGSGEREKPVSNYTVAGSVTNYFFMVKDEPETANYVSGVCGGVNAICKDDAGLVMLNVTNIASPTAAQMSGKKGWYRGFAAAGEQVVTSALTIFGTVNFSTHQPAVYGAGSCKPNLGETRLYKRDYLTGKNNNGSNTEFEDVAGDGLPPSPVGGQVVLDNGQVVPFCIGCSKDSPLEGSLPKPMSSVVQPKNRLYWYIQK